MCQKKRNYEFRCGHKLETWNYCPGRRTPCAKYDPTKDKLNVKRYCCGKEACCDSFTQEFEDALMRAQAVRENLIKKHKQDGGDRLWKGPEWAWANVLDAGRVLTEQCDLYKECGRKRTRRDCEGVRCIHDVGRKSSFGSESSFDSS